MESPEEISGRAYTSFPLLKQQLKEDFKVPLSKFVPKPAPGLPPLRNKSVTGGNAMVRNAQFNIGVY